MKGFPNGFYSFFIFHGNTVVLEKSIKIGTIIIEK